MAPLYYGDQELELIAGQTIFDYADSLQVRVPTSCRRSGECHECIVEIRRGMEALSDPSEAEEFLRNTIASLARLGSSIAAPLSIFPCCAASPRFYSTPFGAAFRSIQ